ncbi:MAG: AAA family ATPase [Deltaproteobacteria bacterium]|nr:AAA family ATPase [Deltaproteobacteria bacterium]
MKKSVLPKALSAGQVFAPCRASELKFKNTREVKASDEIISQARAVRAIDMGLGIRKPGYHIYVAGYQGTGKTSVIRTFLEKWSKNAEPPDDWVYVNDFQKSEVPRAICLPAGEGCKFVKTMEKAVRTLCSDIPHVLQSEEYENAVNTRISQNNDRQSRRFSDLEKTARSMDFQIKSTRLGIETIPVIDGRPLTEKEYAKLSEKERSLIEETRAKLEPQVLEFARKVRSLELDAREYVIKLQKSFVNEVLGQVLGPVEQEYDHNEGIRTYLRQIRDHVVENISDFIDDEGAGGGEDEHQFHQLSQDKREKFRKYKVNLFVDNRDLQGAPVVIESNPSYYNLFGKVEKNIDHGMFYTDFTMVKAGAVHRANGGYLVLEASDIFKLPSVWDTLKRILRNRKGFIEDMGEQFSMLPTSGLRPEPVPLDIKVILIGTDDIYHMLHELDEEFSKIFKIKADFDYKMPRNRSNITSYVSFIATRCRKEGLLNFDRSGVAALIEYSSRLVEDQRELSTQFGDIKDLTIEADFIAREQGKRLIARAHVEQALKEKFDRVNLVEEHLLESVRRGDIMLSFSGECIGQVNGLAVYEMGDYAFGKPGRITCTVAAGDEGILNIERSSKLSGNIHDKGVLILTGYLNALLARKESLGMSISLCFEQSYGVIDGDSATIAELVAVISAMAEIPVRLNLAITGSLNQMGDVQPVGGINEKVEGFYKCARLVNKGAPWTVIIPAQNVSGLMLNEETRAAVADGDLRIHPVSAFWEAFELATGVPFGVRSVMDKEFSPGSALEKVAARLAALNADDHHHSDHHHKESAGGAH